jgi:hypothetical protein
MLRSLLTPPKPTIRHRVGTEKDPSTKIHPLGLLRNPWQEYGAAEGSSEAIVAALKEHPLTASEIDVEKHSPAHLNIPPVYSTSFVGKDEMTHGDGHFRELVIGWILSPFLFILPVSTLL